MRNMIFLSLAHSGNGVWVPYTMIVAIHAASTEPNAKSSVLLVTGGVIQCREEQRQLARDVDTMMQRSQARGTRKED